MGSWKDIGGSQGSPLLCKEGRGEVEILPAYTNPGPACAPACPAGAVGRCPHADRSPARPSLWMLLPLLTSPYKGEETEWRPHKSLKSPILKGWCKACPNEKRSRM